MGDSAHMNSYHHSAPFSLKSEISLDLITAYPKDRHEDGMLKLASVEQWLAAVWRSLLYVKSNTFNIALSKLLTFKIETFVSSSQPSRKEDQGYVKLS